MLVFVIEDHEGIRCLLEMVLRNHGYEVRTFDRGEFALFYLNEERPDLILLDLQTDGISPEEFMKQLQATSLSRDTLRIGVLSGSDWVEPIAHKIGADFFIRKPFDEKDLLVHISSSH